MSLYKRLQENQAASPLRRDAVLDELRLRVHHQLIEALGPVLSDGKMSELELRRRVEDELRSALSTESTPLSLADREALVNDVTDDVLGYGPIERFLKDPEVTEVMVNGPENVYVERAGKLKRVPVSFLDENHLRRIIDKIVSQVGRRVDESTPMVDARLPDGSRVNAILHPLAIGGPFLTVRKFSKDPLTVNDMIHLGTFDAQVARFLQACVQGRLNMIISGGTGTGKTTLLNVLSSFIPDDERVITIEDAKELQLRQEHVLPLESRPSNIEGRGEVSIRELVRNALRMRPDRIVVGECRSGEALDMLQAMNTGHDGSLTTIHSNSPRDTLSRIETMTLMAGFDLPVRAIREQMSSALDLIIHLSRLRDGSRRITQISEVMSMEGEIIVMQDIFVFDASMGVDETGRFRGTLKPTGIRPKFAEKLRDVGIDLAASLFETGGIPARGRDRTPSMKRLVAALFAAALGLLAAAPGAAAAESIVIRKLDLSQFPQVTISAQVSGAPATPESFALRENGKIVTPIQVVPLGKTDTPVGIALVIDISGSMRQGSKLVAAKEAAKQFVAQKLENDQIAIVAFNQEAQVVSGFTADGNLLNRAIDTLQATGETALYDGVRTAATLFGDRADLQANILVLSDGKDTASQNSLDAAEGSVLSVKASLFAVGLVGGEFDAGSLRRLSSASGGTYTETTNPESLKGVYQTVQRDIQNQFEISYTSTATESVSVSLATAGRIAVAGPVAAGSVSRGVAVAPEVVGPSRFGEALSGPGSLAAVAVIVFLGAALVLVGVVALTRQGIPGLAARLEPYGPEGGAAFEMRPASGDIELAQTALVRRAVDATARLVKGGNLLDRIEDKLEAADLPVRPAEALFFYGVGVAAAGVVVGLLSGLFFAVLALIVFGLTPLALLDVLGRRRQRKFASQLPDLLRLLASSLRAGFSLLQAADATAEQMDDPMGKELRRVLVEARLGRPLEVALEDAAKRVQVPDFDWVVMAIGIQREVGGNLAELLSTVADTMVARERLRQEVKTLTAEGRISAIVLAALPVVIGMAVYVLNPEYLDPLLHRTGGQLAILGAIAAGIGGFVWMRKIVDIPA